MPYPEIYAVVMEIAAALGETKAAPKYQIDRIIEHFGEAFARDLLAETQAVEAAGGMLTQDGSRRRTPGGIFFYLARGRMTEEQKELIFWKPQRETKQRGKRRAAPPFPWDKRLKMLGGAKQWRRVDDVIKDDRKDKLIVEDKCVFDPAPRGCGGRVRHVRLDRGAGAGEKGAAAGEDGGGRVTSAQNRRHSAPPIPRN